MRKSMATISGCVLLSGAAAAGASDAGVTPDIAIHCGHLIDTQAGKLLGETTVLIRAKRIESVAGGRQAPAGSTEIDLSDQTCLPGLTDSHTHLTEQSGPTFYSD